MTPRPAPPPRVGPVLVVRSSRRDAHALSSGRMLARQAHVGLTILDTTRRVTATTAGEMQLPIDPAAVGDDVAEHAAGRSGSIVLVDADGSGPSGGPLFDHTAEETLRHCRRPVLVFGPSARVLDGPATFVVSVDRAGASERAFAALAPVLHSLARAVIVADVVPVDPWPDDDADPVTDPARHAASVFDELVPTSLVRRSADDVAAALVGLVDRHADAVLVVVATRWHDPADHWYGTARRLIRTAPCPVLVVPTDVRSAQR